mmetsp:Transcript_5414/g.12020  ORF Transcript_5414/g.12020 Transcript_5414/m.12020 type:complete len:100 (+) Transcript_5414:550-849(+)
MVPFITGRPSSVRMKNRSPTVLGHKTNPMEISTVVHFRMVRDMVPVYAYFMIPANNGMANGNMMSTSNMVDNDQEYENHQQTHYNNHIELENTRVQTKR